MPTLLAPLFEHDPSRPAAKAGDTRITYGRLCADIDTMARWLLASGLQPGERITIHSKEPGNPDYWDWILHLGAIRAGLAQSTGGMPPAIAATGALGPYAAAVGYLEQMHPAASPRLKLPFAPQCAEPLAHQLNLPDNSVELEGLENQAARFLSTSGTTGQPKVIHWDSEMLAGRLEQVRNIGDMNAGTRLFTALGIITTTGLRYPFAAWQMGAFVFLASMGGRRTELSQVLNECTFLATSPFRMQELIRLSPDKWDGAETRVIELFGGRVPPALHEHLLAKCCGALRMSYGATEVGRVAAGDTSLVERHPGAVGKVEPGVTLEIVDAAGTSLPPGTRGIVRIKSRYMCHGYVGIPDGPQSPFRDGWFYPGDLGILFEDGVFAVAGRLSETINLSGAKLSPEVLEQRISAFPEVLDACALALQTRETDILGIAVVCVEGTDLKELRKRIRVHLPRQFPMTLINVPQIPRNAMGRVPRQEFAARLVAEISRQKTGGAETTES